MSLCSELEVIRLEAKPLVEQRFRSFVILGSSGTEEELFSELSFCVLTANWSAEKGTKAQQALGPQGFLSLSLPCLEEELSKVGHRYPSARARFIFENRKLFGHLKDVISLETDQARDFLVKEAKGIGWKESSHFLRNVGHEDVAILDRHVVRLMVRYNITSEIPKSWSEKKYIFYESLLRKQSEEFGEPLGKFDLYLWYFVKGRVDK